MSLAAIETWMEQSWLGVAARDVYWVFPAAEMVHFFGLCLLMGSLLMIDLRVLGFARSVSIKKVLAFIPAAGIGLALNIASGIVFLCAYPENYWPSTAFRLKLLAIFIGVLNALWFKWMEAPHIEQLADDGDASRRAKVVALLSLTVWIVVIALGRFLPYVSLSSG
jgi:predicted outer membrane lipoprotein